MKLAILTLTLAAGISTIPAFAQVPQKTFATPQEAAQALVDAAAKNDTPAMLQIFGPSGKDIAQSGDPAADKEARQSFADLARQKMEVRTDPDKDRATIIVGPDDWPVPVPIVLAKGRWRFDSSVGRVEVLARRIGRNELAAIEVCRAYVEAQMEYAARDRTATGVLQYAQRISSTPGKKDGLYWEDGSDKLVPKAFANPAAPYHGYYFRILKAQGPDAPGGAMDYVVKGKMIGGFALVAFPADYGVSGIKTLIINHKGQLYEKDLGPSTAVQARQMTRFNPDKTWKSVTGE
ncbi:MAG TPA: DUF2950 domain-containing protein [Candidatus Sulfopaludibacter sp.]|nr:DUF2950 domain-containing protein [Candidatus Sulfopaludibacter sp.]